MTKFNKEVNNYIINAIQFTDENVKYNKLSDKEKVIKVYEQFQREKPYQLGQRKSMFIDWLQGLPTNFNIDFTCYEQKQLLIKWFGNDVTNFSDETDHSDYFYSVIADQFFKLYVHACYAL